jgi:hypothetical protein
MAAHSLSSLIDFLATDLPASPCEYTGWRIVPVTGGFNNRLFRASGPAGDLAIKFTRRDARDRAGREFQALALLQALGLDLAPRPVLLERERWPLPVVVQTWEEGLSFDEPPASPAEWQRLLEHYAAIHGVRQDPARMLPLAVLTFPDAHSAVEAILLEMEPLLQAGQPSARPWQADLRVADLRVLAGRLAAARFPAWPAPIYTLARCDPAAPNFLRRDGPWLSVDWENSGWGDPAFEIGELLAHPSYRPLDPAAREFVLQTAADLHPQDPAFRLRARVYEAIVLVRWAGLLARYWRERDLGRPDTTRLARWPEEWWAALPEAFRAGLAQAHAALDAWEIEGI